MGTSEIEFVNQNIPFLAFALGFPHRAEPSHGSPPIHAPTPTTSPAPGHAGSHALCRYGARAARCRVVALLKHGSRVEQGDEPLLEYCRVTRSSDLWPLVGPPIRVPLQFCGGTSSEQGTRVALRPSWPRAQGAAAFTTWWKQSMYCTYTNCCLQKSQ